ncbi:hypothetical protein RND81_03G142100 [Saponaria officinalis]
MPLVMQNIRKVLKPNGLVLFRDYATGDLAQERLICKDQKISENFYVRGDGTRAFYFSDEYLRHLFEDNGFGTEEIELCCKQVENRSRELIMNRRWIQGVFSSKAGSNGLDNLCKETLHTKSVENGDTEGVTHNNHTEDVDISEGVAIDMFGVTPSEDEVDVTFGNLNFKIKVVSKEYQHTCKSTGLMIWESARLMASILVENPSITSGKRVLELGCGCAGICSMVAAEYAHLVVATDGDPKALDLLSQNIAKNTTKPDKLLVSPLQWGNNDHIEAIKKLNSGFDIILGTDVTYIPEAILPLFETAQKLISSKDATEQRSEPEPEAALILCHILRRVDEPSIISAAARYGFKLVERWPSESESSSDAQSIMSCWFCKMNLKDIIPSTALSIMYFQKA